MLIWERGSNPAKRERIEAKDIAAAWGAGERHATSSRNLDDDEVRSQKRGGPSRTNREEQLAIVWRKARKRGHRPICEPRGYWC